MIRSHSHKGPCITVDTCMSDETNRRIQVDLSGKRAMVTGASRGIGKSIAVTLGAAGATVVCIARNQEKLQETADIITQQGGTAEVYPCDVVDTDAVQNLFDKFIEKYPNIPCVLPQAFPLSAKKIDSKINIDEQTFHNQNLEKIVLLLPLHMVYILRKLFIRFLFFLFYSPS